MFAEMGCSARASRHGRRCARCCCGRSRRRPSRGPTRSREVTFDTLAPHGNLRVGRPLIPISRMIDSTALCPTWISRPYRSSAVTRSAPSVPPEAL